MGGFFDRLGSVASGLGGAVLAPFGFAKDLAVGAFSDDDEFDGFLGTIWGATKKWGASGVENLIGPEEGLGAAIGALPGSVRRGVRGVTDPVFAGLETAGREVVREPLTALMSAASLMDAGHGFDLREGYKIAQNRSLGQAVALAFLTDDIEDEVEVAKSVGTDWYDAISGTTDALARLMLEPDILAGKFYRGARRASVTGRATQRTVQLPGFVPVVGGGTAVVGGGLFERAGAAAAAKGWVPGARAIRTNKDVNAALVSPELVRVNEHIDTIKREAGVGEAAVTTSFEDLGPTFFWDEGTAAQARQRWDELDDDAIITLYHGTTPERGAALRESGRVQTPEGHVSDLPTMATDSLYVAPTRRDAARYGEDVVEIRARKGDLMPSPEAVKYAHGKEPDTFTALRNSFDGAVLPPGYDIMGGAPTAAALKAEGVAKARAIAKLRDLAFHDHKHGETIATVLINAPDPNVAWGALMGRRADIDTLAGTNPDLAGRIDREFGAQAKIDHMNRTGVELPEEVVALDLALKRREIEAIYPGRADDIYYHGSSDVSGGLRPISHDDNFNMVGPGLYTTADPVSASRYADTGAASAPVDRAALERDIASMRDMAAKEQNPRRKASFESNADILQRKLDEPAPEPTGHAGVHRLGWQGDTPPKLLDLDQPLPAGLKSMYVKALDDAVAAQTDPAIRARMEALADEVRAAPDDARGLDIVPKVMPSATPELTRLITERLQAMGYDGYRLPGGIGGTDAAAKAQDVSVFFDAAKLGVPGAKTVPPPPASIDDVVTSHMLAAEKIEQAQSMVRELPHISGASQLRRSITRSNFYQQDWRAAPLRLATNMRPRPMVNLEDAGADVQVARVLRKANAPLEVQDQLRGEMAAAMDAAERQAIMARTEAAAIKAVAEKHGMSAAEAEVFINIAARNNKLATSRIQRSRKYDGQGRAYIENRGDDGVVDQIYLPISKTQTFNHYLLADMDAVDRVLAEAKVTATRMNTTTTAVLAGTTELMTKFNQIWKPSVLLRVGWPIRVVGEEQLRIMSQIGALLTAGRTMMAGSRYGKDLAIDAMGKANRSLRRVPKDSRVPRDPRLRGLKLGHMNIDGWEVERAMGTPEVPQLVIQQMNSAKGGVDHIAGVADQELKALQREVTGEWASLDPVKDVDSWGPAWEGAVNAQIRGDEMWRQFIDGKTVDEVAHWIRTTREGKAYLRTVPHWKKNIESWLEAAAQVVDDYLPTPELRQLATQRAVKVDDIITAIPDAGLRPVVHGAVIKDIQGKTAFMGAVSRMRDTAMRVLGTLPTDVLSRQPYFDWHYTNEMRRLITIAGEQGVEFSPELASRFSKQSRTYALGESKKLLYDLADDSELAHTLRFISPFFNASQEVVTRWTGIAVDNPAFVLRLQEVWRAPEKAGIVQDENGNTISADGTYATSALGERVEKGKDRFLSMRLLAQDNVLGKALFNDLTRALPGVKLAETARLNKDGFNTIMQMPGVGPMVQLPLNEIAKSRPQLEDSLKWALPFGATQDTLSAIMPATAKRLQTVSAGEEDRQYANTVTRFYMDALVDFNLEKRATKPTYEEAKKKADEFWKMRTVASFISPVAPSFQSPYQFHIDKYRALMERDPETAMDKFLADEGEDFFPLTQSLTKTMNGVPPTDEGDEAYQKYQDMIQKHPELGGLIIGEEGAGEFSNSVYQKQLSTPLKPGSGDKQRSALSFEEVTKGTDVKLAWREYSRTMDLIEAERIQRGLPNLQVKAAADLASIKRQFIEKHGEKYPDWMAEMNVVDRGAWNRKLAGLKEIAADERLSARPEIQVLNEYLDVRKAFTNELAARDAAGGSGTMTASSNMDLAGMWAQVTGKLTERSLPFSDLFFRYLERDPMTPDDEETAA